ncbi:MAG: trigger factor [Faecalibacterium sp.]|jgi:trigger factor|nr:trigger factor [Faecalibacterium sp.]
MKLIKSEKLEKSMHELQFSIDADAFKAAVADVFKREGKKYSVPGFRKGKAPRHLIEQMYGKDVFTYDAINDLFPAAYEQALKEAAVEAVGRPDVSVDSADGENGVQLTVKVAEKPEVKVSAYTGLAVEKTVHTVEDSEIADEIKRMQERNARECTRDGASENGDIVDIDFDGYVDGKAFEGGKAEHYMLTLGSGSFIPGFEEQCVGHKAGEDFDVNVTFPKEYQAEELAGKDATFKIKLHEVKYKELPELDDDFAKDVSEYDTLDALKDSIRKQKQEQYDKQDALDVENKLVDQVVGGMEAEIPQDMYEARMDEMVNDFAYRVEQQGLKLDQYLKYMGQTVEQFRQSFMPQAEKQVKIRLALEAVAAKEKIEAAEDDVSAEIKRIADQYKMEEEKVKGLVNLDDLKKDLAVNKAIDFLKEKAKITEKPAEKADEAAKKEESAE